MQMVKKIALALLAVYIAVIVFAPKSELYYLMEQRLKEQGIILSGERISEGLFGLSVEAPVIFYKGSRVGSIEKVRIDTLLLATRLTLTRAKIDKGFAKILPIDAEAITVTHWIGAPLELGLNLQGNFGRAEGVVDFGQKSVHLKITEEKALAPLKRYLKKSKEGWYYAAKF